MGLVLRAQFPKLGSALPKAKVTFSELSVNLGVWVGGSRISLEHNSGNLDCVKSFLVVPKTHCMSLGNLPYFSEPCFTWWGEDELGHHQRLKRIKVFFDFLKKSNKKIYREKQSQ